MVPLGETDSCHRVWRAPRQGMAKLCWNTEEGMEPSLGEGGGNVGVAQRKHLELALLELCEDQWKLMAPVMRFLTG